MARGRQAGISLLAVLIALVTIAAAAAIAIPAFFERRGVTLENACRTLARDLRAAQHRAAYLGIDVRFELEQDGYRALDPEGRPVARSAGKELLERRFSRDGVFEGVTLEAIDFGDDRAVLFDWRGTSTESGSVRVAFRGESRRLRLERGSASIYLADSGHPADSGYLGDSGRPWEEHE
jgi:type II secretory pathway pseudopilin PulG